MARFTAKRTSCDILASRTPSLYSMPMNSICLAMRFLLSAFEVGRVESSAVQGKPPLHRDRLEQRLQHVAAVLRVPHHGRDFFRRRARLDLQPGLEAGARRAHRLGQDRALPLELP